METLEILQAAELKIANLEKDGSPLETIDGLARIPRGRKCCLASHFKLDQEL